MNENTLQLFKTRGTRVPVEFVPHIVFADEDNGNVSLVAKDGSRVEISADLVAKIAEHASE